MIGKKTKIALCISGEPRNTMFCYPYIYENFIRLNPEEYEIDIYYYGFSSFRALPLYAPKQYHIDDQSEHDLFKNWFEPFEEKFKPEISFIFTQDPFCNFNNYNNLKNMFLMYFNIHHCFNRIQDDYDMYIRIRPDLLFETKFDLTYILDHMGDKNYDICLPYTRVNNEFGDQLAIANYKGMKAYSDMLPNLHSIINHTKKFKSEELLYHYLSSTNLNIFTYRFLLRIIRKSYVSSNLMFNYLNE